MIRSIVRAGVLLVALAGGLSIPAGRSEAVANLAVAIDCDTATSGVQDTCAFSAGVRSVDVVLTNNGPSFQMMSFSFAVETDQTVLDPLAISDEFNGNPDFQISPTTDWACQPPLPNPDADASPAVARSVISCWNPTTPMSVAGSTSVVLARVSYNSAASPSASLVVKQVEIMDETATPVGSCDPVIVTAADCYGATVYPAGTAYYPAPARPGCVASPPPPLATTSIYCDTPSDAVFPTDGSLSVAGVDLGGTVSMDIGQVASQSASISPTTLGGYAVAFSTDVNTALSCGYLITLVDINGDLVGDLVYHTGFVVVTELVGGVPVDRGARIGTPSPGTFAPKDLNLLVQARGGGLFSYSCSVLGGANWWFTGTAYLSSNTITTAGVAIRNADVVNTAAQPIGVSAGSAFVTFTNPTFYLGPVSPPILIDPSGYVYESPNPATRIPGASVRLERWNGSAFVAMNPVADAASMDPDINPEFTDANGQYKWDVAAGEYRVVVAKSGCTTVTSAPVTIPPPVLDLNIAMTCADSDGDGLRDWRETNSLVFLDATDTGTNPSDADTDNDGWNDGTEVTLGSDPLDPDMDNDTVLDPADNCRVTANADQAAHDLNFIDNSPPYSSGADDKTHPNSDAAGDACDTDDDNDGIPDTYETSGAACAGKVTDPVLADTDGDRALDGAECALGKDPASSSSKPSLTDCGATSADADGDKVQDRIEFCHYNTSGSNIDTDGDRFVDGAKDGCEIASLNGDRTVNSGDQGMLGFAIAGNVPYTVNVDLNKDGNINSGDQGMMGQFIAVSGACPTSG